LRSLKNGSVTTFTHPFYMAYHGDYDYSGNAADYTPAHTFTCACANARRMQLQHLDLRVYYAIN